MKELSIEEKARAYDKALERAQALYNDKNEIGYANAESVLEEVFPLLKESEDEKIRKELIDIVAKSPITFAFEDKNKVLAWLEKQGEQKPTLRERYKNIAESEWFKKTHDGMSVSDDEEPKWTDDDERILKDILVDVKFEGYNNDMLANSYKKINWLKSLKEKFKIQTRQGISKEDEYSFMLISGLIRQDQDLSPENKNKLRLWLKSIIYQSRWKPSMAQLNALSIVSKGNAPDDIEAIVSLYNDLKKLKGG